jgi:23S rRNA pseudouridine1911/1915/1917 synthase
MHNLSKGSGNKAVKNKQIYFQVTENCELLNFLIAQMPDKSRNTIKSLLSHRQVSVDYKICTQYNRLLTAGQEIIINKGRVQEQSTHKGLKIVFEDQYLIVIEKHQGLLSIASDKEKIITAYSILSKMVKRENPDNLIFVVHRLDRETSGLMLFARSHEVQQLLQKAWQDAVVERSYIAVVEGCVVKEQGTITSWLKENKALVMYSSPKPNDGQKAVTHYKTLQKNENFSMLEVQLETGRKNQIRVHMKDIGHSVIGDTKYGATQNPIGRLGLHARILSFRHPVTGREVRFETPVPGKFLALFRK